MIEARPLDNELETHVRFLVVPPPKLQRPVLVPELKHANLRLRMMPVMALLPDTIVQVNLRFLLEAHTPVELLVRLTANRAFTLVNEHIPEDDPVLKQAKFLFLTINAIPVEVLLDMQVRVQLFPATITLALCVSVILLSATLLRRPAIRVYLPAQVLRTTISSDLDGIIVSLPPNVLTLLPG